MEIKKKYKSEKYIIPIGKDCHAAHSLDILNIRNQSLPYDWIRLQSISGLRTVSQNIKEHFKFFLSDLKRNEKGNTYAAKYPEAEFTHTKAVIDNPKLRITYEKRCQRLQEIIRRKPVAYLYILEIKNFKTREDADFFCHTVKDFTKILKTEDSLHIYIRFDEEIENAEVCNLLLHEVQKKPQVYITTYIREKAKFGIWGNEKEYPKLYKRLNLKIKRVFPSIAIK
ncbi:DUF1796 family putative cysteine peptidase [Chryseobacterium sp. MEBOG07]|uniref:DUF1796 family putative cysteine peptidase n=1 Tax=Chryseobacterium sp. MEBOG07 TaxID=2879939 RepID=UPI001F2CE4B9|nr:DUF1796 family putative cysteine peptidase [Chryseobacterium sp. MEBOG07]UKB79327.1 papain-like cysteine peptidase [Chryseobacterium sp. MEBOG07]